MEKTQFSPKRDSATRGNASQFFVAGELCRREIIASITLGNSPNVDILCSNKLGTRFVHVQVKTFVPGAKSVLVGRKASVDRGPNLVWVLAGIPREDQPSKAFEYYVIPSPAMAAFAKDEHGRWLATPGRNGQPHQDNSAVAISLSSTTPMPDGTISSYLNKWSHIKDLLSETGREKSDENFLELDWESESDMKFLETLNLGVPILDKTP